MCVCLASHGLIASHLAIYKQASLKNNECVKSTNANSTPGNCRLVGRGGADVSPMVCIVFE